jgi:hypothetical protein
LNTALANVAVYRNWKNLDPGVSYPLDLRYASLPFLTKKDIREHSLKELLPEGTDVDRAIANREIGLVATSGTTEDKIINIWYQKWWDASEKAPGNTTPS